MKRISLLIYSLVLVAATISCKKDLGNYDYKKVDLPLIDASAMQTSYNVEQFGHLTIVPKIDYAGDAADLSFQWFTYTKSLSSLSDVPRKLLAETRDLNAAVDIPPGNYFLELIVTDKRNGIKINSQTLLNVLASMETGWLVLHSNNNTSDVDFIASKNLTTVQVDKRIKNLFLTTTGASMPGEAQMLGYSRRSNSAFNFITVGNAQGIKRMNGFSFANLGTDAELFRRPLTLKNFQAHINNGSNELIINNGALQPLTWSVVQDALYSGVFNGDYYLAPYLVFNDFSSYGALVYDQKYGKFMYTTQVTADLTFQQFKPSLAGQAFNPANVGKEMLYMDRGFNKHAYAFFKDKTGNGRYLYILNVTKPDGGDLAEAAYDMTAMPEIQNAIQFQVGDVGNVALYATDRKIYRFDYSGSGISSVNFDALPAGETITCLRIFKPRINLNSTSAEFAASNNAVVFLATWNGTQGKLYELAMNAASGIINPVPLKTYEGFGKIKEMITKFRGTGI
jgi:hypothetical protein